MKAYLVLYNLVNAIGWAYVLYLSVTSFLEGKSPAAAWKAIQLPLLVTQSLAGLEILHSFLRLVPSPIMSTFMQVFSRYAVMWGYTYVFAEAQAHWSLYLMVTSWSLVEVPRYLFYAVNLLGSVPFPLFWLRYTLFAILYPTGISGEILQIVTSLPVLLRTSVPCWYLSLFLLSLYLPGSPFMFLHMVTQRKKSFKARKEKQLAASGKAAPAPPSSGVDFPIDEKGQRSTTVVNQGAFVASIAAVDKVASEAAAKEKNWRFGYAKHVVKNVELCCASEAQCITICKAGLEYLHSKFEFSRPEGQPKLTVMQAMDAIEGTFYTYTIEGDRKRDPNFEYYVPYQKFGRKSVKNLTGKELIAQLDVWVARGTIEKDARDAIANLVNKPEYHSTALKDMYFVLLGAMSAMGPLRVLLELGANIVAVDINRKPVWQALIKLARNSPGRVLIPTSKPKDQIKDDDDLASCAGADLLQQTPQIGRWIASLSPKSRLVIGGYAYLDSALFVRLAIAMDAIMATVLKTRKDAALAFLCSPTDVFVTENECRDAQKSALKKIPVWQTLLRLIVSKKMLVPNAIKQVVSGNDTYSIVDGLAVAQGPNYALAKRLQHWRCMLARSQGHTVSTNIAPSTATASVVHNPQFAAAYIGMGYFAPLEIVYQDLSNATMTALLLNDVVNPAAAANPKNNIGNQIRLFSKTSLHFGIWRMAFKCGSIGEVSALIGYGSIYKRALLLVGAGFGAFVAFTAQNGAPHTF
ncbi:tyrosine phosphatase, putative [Bodo saltans]|uniref:very-long-chain (3R)-3-hydroxyacyl-CoA dehydratase n=1 Tax=Bodo saltans TaxID=75058 RepID=A0A0S4JJY4_BODSA|nr:tyrosine phosphatase, putative [Bodo saltans]|eukprot:CUG90501.1 tyrosine phosphatase, putative [Bodo saltans]